MGLTEQDVEFLDNHRSAAMVTLAADGTPKVARVGIAVLDGRLLSSGTEDRVRTRRLRRDPRCTLYVPDPAFAWMALETTVSILDGPDVPQLHVRLFRVMQDRPSGPLQWFGGELEEDEFVSAMIKEQRVLYEFDVRRSYGLH
jgi:PPOX class probable F420-dependent enzyme